MQLQVHFRIQLLTSISFSGKIETRKAKAVQMFAAPRYAAENGRVQMFAAPRYAAENGRVQMFPHPKGWGFLKENNLG